MQISLLVFNLISAQAQISLLVFSLISTLMTPYKHKDADQPACIQSNQCTDAGQPACIQSYQCTDADQPACI